MAKQSIAFEQSVVVTCFVDVIRILISNNIYLPLDLPKAIDLTALFRTAYICEDAFKEYWIIK